MKKIIILCLLISSSIYSQSSAPTEQTSNRIKVYSPETSSQTPTADTYKWTVKTDIISFISGEFPIIGEYRILKSMSIEASAGATYGLYSNFGLLSEDEYDGDGSTFDTKAAMGTSFRAGIKYFPSSDYDAIEGWAFGIQAFTRTNNREYTSDGYNNDYDLSGELDTRNKTGLALTISKQVFDDSNICYEFLLGVGFAKAKHEFYTENYTTDSNSSNSYYLKSNVVEETLPNIQLGLRIGFGN